MDLLDNFNSSFKFRYIQATLSQEFSLKEFMNLARKQPPLENPFYEVYSSFKTLLYFIKSIEEGSLFIPLNPSLSFKEKEELKKYNVNEVANECLGLLTSGTFDSKVVIHSQESLLSSTKNTIDCYKLNEKDVWISTLPLFHVSGIMPLLRMLVSGGTFILSETKTINFKEKFNCISLVPKLLIDYSHELQKRI